MAASFLALAAARRCSRVRVAEDAPASSSAEDSSSSEDSSSEEESTVFAASRGSCEGSGFSRRRYTTEVMERGYCSNGKEDRY